MQQRLADRVRDGLRLAMQDATPSLIGGDGRAGLDSLGVEHLATMPRLRVTERRPAGDCWLLEADLMPGDAAPG